MSFTLSHTRISTAAVVVTAIISADTHTNYIILCTHSSAYTHKRYKERSSACI